MAEKSKKLTDLPYDIHTKIYKNLKLRDIKSLSLANKQMLQRYEDMTEVKMDKIAFDSNHEDYTRYEEQKRLKEIIFNLLRTDISFEESAKFCMRNLDVESIKIRNIISEHHYLNAIPCIYLQSLTHLEISLMDQQRDAGDYLRPILDCTTQLRTLIFENGTFSRTAILRLTCNKELRVLHLRNVYINNMQSLKEMLNKLTEMEEFQYLNFHFTRLLVQIKILNAIFDIVDEWPKLKRIHISAWQAIDMNQINQIRFYKTVWHSCKLRRGLSTSFFLTLLPLMNQYNLNNFEIFYSNNDHPNPCRESSSLRYKLVDVSDQTIKNYRFNSN